MWRQIDGFPDYEVNEAGEVRSWKLNRPRILRPVIGGGGYPEVHLRGTGKAGTVRLHRLVMAAFVGPCPSGQEVNHINSDRADCRLSNLEYVTRAQNIRHAFNYGSLEAPEPPRGQAHPLSKLTDEMVREIRSSTENGCQLGRRFGVTPQVIYRVRARKMWAHVV